MFHRLTTYFVCIALIGYSIVPDPVCAMDKASIAEFSETELLEKYPGARIIQVTEAEYPALEKKLRQHGYSQAEKVPLQLVQQDVPMDVQGTIQQKDYSDSRDDCAGEGLESAGEQSIDVLVDFTEDMMKTGGNSSSDDAAVLFIVIGTIVVVVWALYVFKYLYDVSVGLVPCGRWNEVTAVTGSTSTNSNQHARFDGLRYATGFRDGIADIGISFELGQADILLTEVGVLELKGRYWLMGPMLRWRFSEGINPLAFQLNFTAGTTEHSEVGLLAKASMAILFGIGESVQIGLSWGALNINLDEDQGIISDHSQYHYLYGINLGYRF